MPYEPIIAAPVVTLTFVPPEARFHAEKLPDSNPSAKILLFDGVAVRVAVGSGVFVLVAVEVGMGVWV